MFHVKHFEKHCFTIIFLGLKAFWNFFSDDFAFFDGFQVILQCQNIFSVLHSFYKMFHVKHFNF